jgi:hypothetical protein
MRAGYASPALIIKEEKKEKKFSFCLYNSSNREDLLDVHPPLNLRI